MYQPISMIGVPKGINQRWREIPLDFYEVKVLLSQFRKISIQAKPDDSEMYVYIDMDQFKSEFADKPGTVIDLFLSLGNRSVATTVVKPAISPRKVLWNDAFRAGYSVETWNRNLGKNSHEDEQVDALLTRTSPVTSYTEFVQTCLVSVNGFFHIADTDGSKGVVVYEAGSTLKKSKSNQVGLLSFSKVAKIKQIPILPEMLRTRQLQENIDAGEDVQPFNVAGYIHLPGDLINKTVLLVFGGYLITPDMPYFQKVGDNDFVIDFDNYPLLDRYFESLKYLDFSTLMPETSANNQTQIAISELYGDECLKKYLTLSQSFFVVVDTPEIYTERKKLKCIDISGVYVTEEDTVLPLALSTGRMPEYWLTPHDRVYTLIVNDAIAARRTYNKANVGSLPTVSRSPTSVQSRKPADGFLVEIGVDVKYVPV